MGNESSLIQNLHTAMRRYVSERMDGFSEFQRQPGGVFTTSPSLNEPDKFMEIMPRMIFLNSVRWELAAVAPQMLETWEAMREIIKAGAIIGRDHALGGVKGDSIGTKAVGNEYESFLAYLYKLSPAELQSVEPLPHFHSLSKEEYYARFTAFQSRWGITVKEGWFPHDYYPAVPRPTVQVPAMEAFEVLPLVDANGNIMVKQILKAKGIDHIFIYEESYPAVECALEMLDLARAIPRIVNYIFSESLDWMIHTSWQATVTIGGEWLLDAVKREWPDWENHIQE